MNRVYGMGIEGKRPCAQLEYESQDSQGRTWCLHTIEFNSPDGTYEFYIYAIDEYHARLQLEAIMATGKVTGKVLASYDA